MGEFCSKVKSGTNKHLSSFGKILTYSEIDDEIIGCELFGETHRVDPAIVFKVTLDHSAIQWKLWWKKLIILENSGDISIYQVDGSKAVLQFKSESNMMIMYKNPCFLFRDIIFCSTSASVGLIVRTSYWLLGWNIEKNGGKLTRALDQDKLNPTDDVWCLALRRNCLVCGTEGGCLVVFVDNKTDAMDSCDPEMDEIDFQFKRGHSKIELEFEKYRTPAFKKIVSKRPILSVDIGFFNDKILLYYRTDIKNISCIIIQKEELFIE